jgi:hypothetical protein
MRIENTSEKRNKNIQTLIIFCNEYLRRKHKTELSIKLRTKLKMNIASSKANVNPPV